MNQTGGQKTIGEKIRLGLGIALALYGVLFVVLNANYQSTVWVVVGVVRTVPTLVVIVVTVVLTLVTQWLIRTGMARWLMRRAGTKR